MRFALLLTSHFVTPLNSTGPTIPKLLIIMSHLSFHVYHLCKGYYDGTLSPNSTSFDETSSGSKKSFSIHLMFLYGFSISFFTMSISS